MADRPNPYAGLGWTHEPNPTMRDDPPRDPKSDIEKEIDAKAVKTKTRQMRYDAGLCIQCGNNPAVIKGGRQQVHCSQCAERNRAAAAKQRRGK